MRISEFSWVINSTFTKIPRISWDSWESFAKILTWLCISKPNCCDWKSEIKNEPYTQVLIINTQNHEHKPKPSIELRFSIDVNIEFLNRLKIYKLQHKINFRKSIMHWCRSDAYYQNTKTLFLWRSQPCFIWPFYKCFNRKSSNRLCMS